MTPSNAASPSAPLTKERDNAHYSADGLWYSCWLIERRDRGAAQWWDSGGWTKKAHNATWFARQCDAENLVMLNRHWGAPTAVVVCEHAFMLEQPDKPPSYFTALGSPCCSCWGKSELEWIAEAYVRALAKDGDVWKRLTREQVFALLTPEETGSAYQMLKFDHYQGWFDIVSDTLINSAGARRAWWAAK